MRLQRDSRLYAAASVWTYHTQTVDISGDQIPDARHMPPEPAWTSKSTGIASRECSSTINLTSR